MKQVDLSGQARRALAFVVDAGGFTVLAWLVCRSIDHATKVDFAPHQAAKAFGRMVPALALISVAWWVGPVLVLKASVGKWLVGLRVVRAGDGQPLSVAQVLIRELALKPLSLAMNGAGLIDGLLTGLTFHDRLIGSRVEGLDDWASEGEAWSVVTWPAVAATTAVTAFLLWSTRTNGLVAHLLWSGAFYVPHEAGHLIVGLVMPHLVGVAAGAFGQLLFPSIAIVAFARRQWSVQLAGALVWLAFSLFDIGQYASDAWYRELALPVAAGDELTEDHLESHDWWQLLSAAKVLRYAEPVGQTISGLGWLALAVSLGFLLMRAAGIRSAAVREGHERPPLGE